MAQLPIPDNQPLVVFTDLDGTLLDHHNYDAGGSAEAIRKLIARRTPLVFCSSKTFAEQAYLQRQFNIIQPFIFENGSAAAIPAGFFPENGFRISQQEGGYDIVVFAHKDISSLHSALTDFKKIKGYKAAGDVELSEVTGLSGAALQRARERWFTETLLTDLDEDQVVQLHTRLKPAGFALSRGGRFYTVQSAQVNKGKTVQWMMELFRQTASQLPCFAAIGDSLNDVSMLEVVDVPFLVQGPAKTWVGVKIPRLVKIRGVGPVGFSMAIQQLVGA